MKVLVTGATSLLGGQVVERLTSRGDSVTVLQRNPSGIDGVEEALGDIADPATYTAIDLGSVDAVIHLAAKVGVTGTQDAFERTNVTGTKVILEAAHRAGVGRFVYVSSPSVAHGGHALVGVEAAPADPSSTRGHYATTKAIAEQFVLNQSTTDFPVLALRPHLVWGPGDTQLIGRIVERARQGRLAMVGQGTALIDTTYIDNAADALVAGIDRAPDLAGEALVISNAQPRPISELIERIVGAAGLPAPTRAVPAKVAYGAGLAIERIWDARNIDDDPPMTSFVAEQLATAHWFDQRKTQQSLGWKPLVSLDEGFRRLTEWFQNQATVGFTHSTDERP